MPEGQKEIYIFLTIAKIWRVNYALSLEIPILLPTLKTAQQTLKHSAGCSAAQELSAKQSDNKALKKDSEPEVYFILKYQMSS